MVLEKTLESPLDSKEVKPVNPKGNQPWIFTGRTNAEAEAPILWPSDGKIRLIRKHPDGGKDQRQEEKGMTEDEMVDGIRWSKYWSFNFSISLCNEYSGLISFRMSNRLSRVFSNTAIQKHQFLGTQLSL